MKKIPEIIIALFIAATLTVMAAPVISTVVVGTSETTLLTAGGSSTSATAVSICNYSGNTNSIYVKYSSATNAVTATNGVEVQPGQTLSITSDGMTKASANTITAIAPVNTTVGVQSDNAR